MKVDIEKVEIWLKENFGDSSIIDCYGNLTNETEVTSSFDTMEELMESFYKAIENTKTKPEPKFKIGDKITKGKTQLTILNILFDKYVVEDNFGECAILYFNTQNGWKMVKDKNMIYYVAADRNGEVFLYEDEPTLGNGYWQPSGHRWYKVSPSLFPNVTFVNSPMKVEIKLIEE